MRNLLFLSITLLVAQAVARTPVRLGYFEYPPYIYLSKGVPTGRLIKILNELEQKHEVRFVLEEVPEGRIDASLDENVVDGFAMLAKTPEREKKLHFTSVILLHIDPQVCSTKPFTFTNLERFKSSLDKSNTHLILSNSRLFTKLFTEVMNKTILAYSDSYQERALKMLQAQRAKFAVFPDLTIKHELHCHKMFPSRIEIPLSLDKNKPKLHRLFE